MSGLFAPLTPATIVETFTVARVTKRKSGVYNSSDLASLGHLPLHKGGFCRGQVSRPAGSDPHIVLFSAGHMGPALRRNEEMAGWKDKKYGAGGECTISCFANRQNLLYHEFV